LPPGRRAVAVRDIVVPDPPPNPPTFLHLLLLLAAGSPPNLPPRHDRAQPVAYRREVLAEQPDGLPPGPERVADVAGQGRHVDGRGSLSRLDVEQETAVGLLGREGVGGEVEVLDVVVGSGRHDGQLR